MLLLATTVTLGLVGAHLAEAFLRSRFEDRMAFLARYLARNAELGILIGDQPMLERLADNLLAERDVVQVIIEDADGRVLVRVGPELRGPVTRTNANVRLQQEEENRLFVTGLEGKEVLGQVHILYSTAGIDELLSDFRARYAWAAVGLAAISFLVSFIFSRSLVAPVRALVGASRRVGIGDLDLRVDGGSLPETRELAEAFNQMLVSLAESRTTLEATYQEMAQQKALAQVGHFALTVAHEVKNPLGIIQGAVDILGKPEVDAPTRATMIEYVKDEVQRLDRLIQDFLVFARPRQPNFDAVDLEELLQGLVERLRLEWQQHGVIIETSMAREALKKNEVVRGDRDLLSQAFLNLIKNACEACGDGGHVTVTAEAQTAEWVVRVSDNGPGIPSETQERIFEPFFTTKAQGVGLGLAFVARVIEAHGGEVGMEGNRPHGAVFEVRLPLHMG